MSSCNEKNYAIGDVLNEIHLDVYWPVFQKSGYHTVLDCEKLNHEILQQIGISLTGHRKRILWKIHSLLQQLGKEPGNSELSTTEKDDEVKCLLLESKDFTTDLKSLDPALSASALFQIPTLDVHSKTRTFFTEEKMDQGETYQHSIPKDSNDRVDEPQLPEQSLEISDSYNANYGALDNESQSDSKSSHFFEFKGPMIENEIYDDINGVHKPLGKATPSRSFILRNRPVPDLPFSMNTAFSKSALCDSPSSKNACEAMAKASEESIYSTMEEYTLELGMNKDITMNSSSANSLKRENDSNHELEGVEHEISPYACFYGPSPMISKTGWLEKLSPHSSCLFQKRWVKADGHGISYYNNDREVFSKGKISISAIRRIQTLGENKFEVVTSQRTFIFRVEKEGDRHDWISTLLEAFNSKTNQSPALNLSEKHGHLELKGYKHKIFSVLNGSKLWLSKSKQDASAGITITDITMTMVSIKSIDRKCFEIITPCRIFSFTAESEREKQEWIEAVQQSIAETLADYEVAEKIWFNESNRSCADCRAPNPDWASISLGVVICKNCAGQHQTLGSKISQVHSLKLNTTIWSNELVELFIVLGNEKVNSIWEANLFSENMLKMDSNVSQRRIFITQKYKEGRFKKIYSSNITQEQLNKALCDAVITSDLLETMILVFNGADIMCATGDPINNTPYLLAKMVGQSLQMEFLHHNRFSDYKTHDFLMDTRKNKSLFYCGFLFKATSVSTKMSVYRKLKEEMKKWWCTIDNSFLSYYENETTSVPDGVINLSEGTCMVVHSPDSSTNLEAKFTFEIYLLSESMFLFGAEDAKSQREWTRAIAKNFIPTIDDYLVELHFNVIGYLYYKDSYSLNEWKEGWFALDRECLHYCKQENGQADVIQLKKLQELTTTSSMLNDEKKNILLLVEHGRTLYIHGHTILDFMVWHSTIEKAAGTDGNSLQDQQLSKNNIPIIVNSCIAFVTQYGLGSKSLYLKNGNPLQVRELLEDFKKDARSIKLKVGKHQLEDVTDVLKCFLYEIDDALLTKELYPYWISALDVQDELERVRKYKTLIDTLPVLNKATLAALIEHLYRIKKCSDVNQLDACKLATAFSSCLFQTKGQKKEEICVIEDLIIHYVNIFNVSEEQVQQMDTENHFITKWKESQISHSGDLLIEVYLERKEPDMCVIIRVPPSMQTAELANCAIGIKNITRTREMPWATFEVIENGELERLMHYKEKVLETVLQWCSQSDPGGPYLLVKPFYTPEIMSLGQKISHQMHSGYMKYKEDPSKLLDGNKFKERYFVLRESKLLIYKDIKSIKPEKVLPAASCKFYIGLKKKTKPPTSWGFTVYFEKYQWHLCCDTQEAHAEWLISILNAQYPGDVFPLRKNEQIQRAKSPQMRGMNFEQERDSRKQMTMTINPDLENIMLRLKQEFNSILKQRSSMLTDVLDCKEEEKLTQKKKHFSLINLDDPSNYSGRAKDSTESKNLKSTKDHSSKTLAPSTKLPSNLIKELSSVIEKNKKDT
ncbi:arf-GAP with Rho-GAP domain, ANK repeat and PH domain-containing protein 2 [Rhinophrynus dorsalis]